MIFNNLHYSKKKHSICISQMTWSLVTVFLSYFFYLTFILFLSYTELFDYGFLSYNTVGSYIWLCICCSSNRRIRNVTIDYDFCLQFTAQEKGQPSSHHTFAFQISINPYTEHRLKIIDVPTIIILLLIEFHKSINILFNDGCLGIKTTKIPSNIIYS